MSRSRGFSRVTNDLNYVVFLCIVRARCWNGASEDLQTLLWTSVPCHVEFYWRACGMCWMVAMFALLKYPHMGRDDVAQSLLSSLGVSFYWQISDWYYYNFKWCCCIRRLLLKNNNMLIVCPWQGAPVFFFVFVWDNPAAPMHYLFNVTFFTHMLQNSIEQHTPIPSCVKQQSSTMVFRYLM